MADPVFQLRLPQRRTCCAVFSSPHSGANYAAGFPGGADLDPPWIRSSEDAFVDELFASAPDCGAPLLAATIPRACVDLNRAPEELDPALISGTVPRILNPRIAAGLGVIPRVVAEGRPIIRGKVTLAEAQHRIARYWHPYHECLRTLLAESRTMFGAAILFDCHSMPHDALSGATPSERRPDLILGDRFGAACDRWLTDAATDIFEAAGFAVGRNAPFAGGYITQTYGRPGQGIHALQIEIDRVLYMDEARILRGPDFAAVCARIAAVVADLATLGPRPRRIAAE